jgi:hypothetical protein
MLAQVFNERERDRERERERERGKLFDFLNIGKSSQGSQVESSLLCL